MKSRYDIEDVEDLFSDCFAKGKYSCTALVEMECKTKGKCNFYMSKKEYEAKLRRLKKYDSYYENLDK